MTGLSAQDTSFEVVSVKVNPRGEADENAFGIFRPGQVNVRSGQLRYLVPAAFGIPSQLGKVKFDFSRVSDDLLERTYFDIQAKGSPTGDQAAMMRTLLRERFGLKWHNEMRTVPLYTLTVKQPGKLGPWLKPSAVDCRKLFAEDPNAGAAECRAVSDRGRGLRQIRSSGSVAHLVTRLQELSDFPLVDATGLKGTYSWDFAMPYVMSRSPQFAAAFRDALEDELGLTLTRTTGPWEVIVIDDLRMPTPN
jgi:uncharacterized protein (TIGR03435 family)